MMGLEQDLVLPVPPERHGRLGPGCPLLAVAAALYFAATAPAQTVTAIRDATVLTMTGDTIPNGTVLIRDGKIMDVGRAIPIPAGATTIDARGKYVIPGLIDAMTYFGIRPTDRNDPSKPVTPENRIINAYAPFSDFMGGRDVPDRRREVWSGGVTTIYIAPGDAQVIGGQGAVVKTDGGPVTGTVLREPASIDMTLGDPPKKHFAAKKQSPSTRMSEAALIRGALVQAQEYGQALARQKEKAEEGTAKRDLGNEALFMLLSRKVPVRVQADLADDIRTAIRLAEEFGLELVIDGGIGAHEMASELARKKIPVVLAPVSRTYMTEVEGGATKELFAKVNERSAAVLAGAGVKVAMASFGYSAGYTGSTYQGRWMLLEAAVAAGFGLSEEEALKAVTIHPAEILGVADRVGSITKGKDADLVVLDGPPLSPATWVEKVFINGLLVYEQRANR